MKIKILVKPNSRKKSIEKLPDGSYRISVRAPARQGCANEAVLENLAKFFNLPKSKIHLLKGANSRIKWIEIM